jgi:hypothetical protein
MSPGRHERQDDAQRSWVRWPTSAQLRESEGVLVRFGLGSLTGFFIGVGALINGAFIWALAGIGLGAATALAGYVLVITERDRE